MTKVWGTELHRNSLYAFAANWYPFKLGSYKCGMIPWDPLKKLKIFRKGIERIKTVH
jgi:hypothetical protein